MPSSTEIADRFQAMDRLLADRRIFPLSLCPERRLATTFQELFCNLRQLTDDGRILLEIGRQLYRAVDAQIVNFPQNIYWDFDYLAGVFWRAPSIVGMGETGEKIVQLQALFGVHSPIRFCYVHDFTYGYDWARWVRKAPQARQNYSPYDRVFLDYMLQRGQEILAAIAANDPIYPQLDPAQYRNRFAFSRAPADETRLLTDLARSNTIPIQAWRFDAVPEWRLPYADLRCRRARELGIAFIE